MNPPINPGQSSDEDQNNYESAGENDPNNLVSPNRPHQSPSASPRALLRPDPPPVDEVLQEVGQQLRNLHPNRQQRAERRNAVRQAQQVGEEVAQPARVIMPNPPVVNYDKEEKADGATAANDARHIKVEFDQSDIKFWFAQLEDEMTMASVGSQWLKKTVLQRNLPLKQKEDVKGFFTLQKDQAGNHIYFDIKSELIRIYDAKPCDAYKRALTRTMTGLPSQLGFQIVGDVCKKPVKFADNCCCPAHVFALWSMQLPIGIRAHISNMVFTKETYKEIFEAADKVYLAQKQVSVAAVATSVAAASLDETLPAFSSQNQPTVEVAAASRGRGGGRGRGNRGGGGRGGSSGTNNGGGGNQSNRNNRNNRGRGGANNGQRGPRHSSSPPEACCDRHYVHGDQAYYCLAPLTCPWASKVIQRP